MRPLVLTCLGCRNYLPNARAGPKSLALCHEADTLTLAAELRQYARVQIVHSSKAIKQLLLNCVEVDKAVWQASERVSDVMATSSDRVK